ncbi:DUF2007 domain-containing protein [Tamlana fucoidanivorans]|uniref:DUF2007 domain-containing protein n=1 Tax=Allotamlana fucoidanivorans TaxID=2583814 RepID=A0A5C4SE44_9FLAO|nr:DUF2007 domain-containing protein [Tamlana fucoidanivorans]TNJ41551.1 DUF2007 domain-containing protein [Tamlana fucoidanivorans]
MTNSNYVKIYTGELIVVQRMVSELEKLDIIPVLKDQTDSGLLPIFGSSNSIFKQVYVHKDELDTAQKVVDAISSELEELQ